MAGVATAIHLTKEEQSILESWGRNGTTEQRLVQRARIVLDGERPPPSARQRAAQRVAVARWARRDPFVAPATVQALLAWLMEPWNG